MSDSDIQKLDQELNKILDSLINDLKAFKTGRASVNLLDHVFVNIYGTNMPLKQVANITVVDAHLIQVTPYDNNNLNEISNTLRSDSSLNLNPVDDGRNIRLNIPPLTEERRKELVKIVHQKSEEYMIKIRQKRHDFLAKLNQEKNNKNISEDQFRSFSKKIDEKINLAKNKLENIIDQKDQEIMTI